MAYDKKIELKDYLRNTSISCVSEPQTTALLFLKSDDLHSFTDLVNTKDVEIGSRSKNHWINKSVEETGETLLETAIHLRRLEFIRTLVTVGVIRDQVNPTSGFSPLHLVCQAGEPAMLAILLPKDNSDQVDPNVRSSDRKAGWAPLHLAAETPGTDHLSCLNQLLDHPDTEPDVRDIRGAQTPLAVAVLAKNEPAIRSLLRHGANLDLKCGRSTIRQYLTDNLPRFDPHSVKVVHKKDIMLDLVDKMVSLVRTTNRHGVNYKADLGNFRTFARFIRGMDSEPDRLQEVLDLAVEKGLEDHVRLLLRKGVSPNSRNQPLLEAVYKGHHQVVLVLLSDPRTDVGIVKNGTGETVLHLVLKMEYERADRDDYSKTLEILLENGGASLEKMINKKDTLGNTALHYAASHWTESTVRNILELGANIGIKNIWGELPISRIRAQTMQEFLDDFCLSHEGESTMQEDFSLTFDYRFLAPDPAALPDQFQGQDNLIRLDNTNERDEVKTALPETESLWYMGQSKEHRHLLKHPVITSFLWYKWQRIRKYFNRNLRLYFIFVFLLTWFIFNNFGSFSQRKKTNNVFYSLFVVMFAIMIGYIIKDWILDIQDLQDNNDSFTKSSQQRRGKLSMIVNLILSNWVETLMIGFMVLVIILENAILKPGITALLVILLFIEIFQLMVSIKRYVFSIENWIEVSMIIIVSVILYNDGSRMFDLNRNLAAIAIFFSWSKVITLIGKHPKHNRLNIYVTMFFKVLKSFFFFLAWYGLFIVAFGLSFFIMLHEDLDNVDHAVKEKSAKDDEYVFFNTTFLSVVKTLTMFVGELEFSDIPIDLEKPLYPLNYLFFLLFIFLIVVVLMNLLNGLAVSDTGLIQEQAEIYSHLSRVDTISYLESILLGDPFDFLTNVPRLLASLPSCSLLRQLHRSPSLRRTFAKVGAGSILLFYNNLSDKKSPKVLPNKKTDNCSCISSSEMGQETLEAAKKIVSEKMKSAKQSEDLQTEEISLRIQRIEQKLMGLASLESKIDKMLAKIR